MWSIDVTLTGHRMDVYRSFSVKGQPPPNLGDAISRFTNAIVTAISSLGFYYKSMLFTCNAAFRRDRKRTSRRDEQVAALDRVLTLYKVEPYRIVYVGKDKHETRTYVPASVDIVKRFLDTYDIDVGSTWLSDNGNEFFPEARSTLASYGVIHVPYPAAVHQYLSANDNNHHSAAKAKWRTMKLDFSDDVTTSIALLSCFDNDEDNIDEYFASNLQLRQPRPDLEKAKMLIGGNALQSNSYYKQCMYEYCIAFEKDGRGYADKDDNDGLDGIKWQ